MSQPRFAALRSDIAREMEHVQRLVSEADEWREQLPNWPESIRVRTGGGILHDFYCGIERVFRLIAARVDEDLPGGADWHIQLLRRMATPIDAVRPAVIDRAVMRQLDEYLRFRHLFRNIYGFDLEWDRCRDLLERLPLVHVELVRQVDRFDTFLHTLENQL